MSAPAGVGFEPSQIRRTTWKEMAVRFLFGGAIAVVTGVLAKQFGPAFGGLFLAFPAILPASLTLVEEHDGHRAAQHSSLGAIAGSVGLAAFAAAVRALAPRVVPAIALGGAALVWLVVSAAVLAAAVAVRARIIHQRTRAALPRP